MSYTLNTPLGSTHEFTLRAIEEFMLLPDFTLGVNPMSEDEAVGYLHLTRKRLLEIADSIKMVEVTMFRRLEHPSGQIGVLADMIEDNRYALREVILDTRKELDPATITSPKRVAVVREAGRALRRLWLVRQNVRRIAHLVVGLSPTSEPLADSANDPGSAMLYAITRIAQTIDEFFLVVGDVARMEVKHGPGSV